MNCHCITMLLPLVNTFVHLSLESLSHLCIPKFWPVLQDGLIWLFKNLLQGLFHLQYYKTLTWYYTLLVTDAVIIPCILSQVEEL